MTPDPYTYEPAELGLHFRSPWDVLQYHPQTAPQEPKPRGRFGKPFMSPEQRKERHNEICKAYRETQRGKEVLAKIRAKQQEKKMSDAEREKRNARNREFMRRKRGLDSSLTYSRA